jgi:hypothetical protein
LCLAVLFGAILTLSNPSRANETLHVGKAVPGLLDAAVEEWESRVRAFVEYYDDMLAQSKPAARRRITGDDLNDALPF